MYDLWLFTIVGTFLDLTIDFVQLAAQLQSKNDMLFWAMRKCRIWIRHEILSFVDLKISKIEPEMAESSFSRVSEQSISHRKKESWTRIHSSVTSSVRH